MWKKIIIFLLALIPLANVSAIVLQVPNSQWQEDVEITGPTQVQWDETSFFTLVQIVNDYLRFAVGVVCMIVLVIGWFKLMTAQWDQEKMKQGNKLLMWALIGILIAILSYAIIRLVVNLFG